MRNGNSLILVLILLVMSCDSNRVYDAYSSLPDQWHRDSIVQFEFNPPDTLNSYNLIVNLRNTDDYRYSNLFLILELNYPNGKTIRDTLEYQMTAPDGTFLGKGFTDIKENKLWYKEDFVFEEDGTYRVNIAQAMRENGRIQGLTLLSGITEVGFRIEKQYAE